jgi:sucrose-phosphate synthase
VFGIWESLPDEIRRNTGIKRGCGYGHHMEVRKNTIQTHFGLTPDVLITSLGTEIYYPPRLTADVAWN